MPPQLALLLCTSFVSFILRFERQLAPDASRAVWLPTVWLFSIGTKPLGVWLASASGDEYGSPWDQYFQIALLVLGLLVLVTRQFSWSNAARKYPWLLLLVFYMLISSLWSDMLLISAKRFVRQLVAIVMAFVVLSEHAPIQAVESVLRRSAYILLPFSMLLIKYYPDYGVQFHTWTGDRMWVGVSLQKNGLARVCIIALLFLIWTIIRRWLGRAPFVSCWHNIAEYLVLLVGLYMFLLPQGKASATSLAAFGVGLGSLCGLAWLRRRHYRLSVHFLVFIVLSIIIYGISLPLFGKGIGTGISETLGRDATLTGRADTWAEIVPIAMQHPILGCGFGSYWTPLTRELHRNSNAHNAYLEVFNELGAVGLVIFALFLVSLATTAHQFLVVNQDWGELCIAYVIMAVLHGIAESSINSFTCHFVGTLLLLSASCIPRNKG